MKTTVLSIIYLLATLSFFPQEQPTGKWLTDSGDSVIDIYRSGEKLNGKITWLKDANDHDGKPITDKENPDKSKQNRPLMGLVMLKDFEERDNKWEGGTIYDPHNGKTYKCSMWIENGKLKVRGYIGMFYQTQTWTRR